MTVTIPEQAVEVADSFMLVTDFKLGAQVRAGKGFTCLREGSVHTVTTDSIGNLCIRCQFEGQKQAGWHYPLDRRDKSSDRLNELYLERGALPLVGVERRAPVQGYSAGIPWSMHLRAYDAYCKKHGPQPALIDLEGRNCRGGFGTGELDMFIPGWRDELSRLTELERANEALHRELDDMTERCRTAEQRVRAALPAQSGVREDVAREQLEDLIENFVVYRLPPRGKEAGQQFTMRTLPQWMSEDEWFLARQAFTDAVLALPHTGQPVEGWRGVLGERLASFISERDPFGDYFSAHDIEQLEKACARIADTRKTMWLVERDGLYTEYRNAGMPNWVTDPWRAAEYESFEDAEYARKRIELDEWRDRSKSVEHIFVNRPKPVDPPKPIYSEAALSPAPASPQPREGEKS